MDPHSAQLKIQTFFYIGIISNHIDFFAVCLFRSESETHGASQARGRMELQLPAYTTTTATRDPSRVCNLHHSSWQHWTLNPLSEARDRTHNLMVPSWIRFLCATTGTPQLILSGEKRQEKHSRDVP